MQYTIERPDGSPVLTDTGRVRRFRTRAAADAFRDRLDRLANPPQRLTAEQIEALEDAEDLRVAQKRLATGEPGIPLAEFLEKYGEPSEKKKRKR